MATYARQPYSITIRNVNNGNEDKENEDNSKQIKSSTQRINNKIKNEGNTNNNEDSRQPPHNEAWKEGMCRTVLTNHIYVKTQRDRVAIKKDNCWGASVSDQNITACALSSSRFMLNNPLGLDVL